MSGGARGEVFVPPSRLARLVSAVYYWLVLRPIERAFFHRVDLSLTTLRARVGFWITCTAWFHYERSKGRA